MEGPDPTSRPEVTGAFAADARMNWQGVQVAGRNAVLAELNRRLTASSLPDSYTGQIVLETPRDQAGGGEAVPAADRPDLPVL